MIFWEKRPKVRDNWRSETYNNSRSSSLRLSSSWAWAELVLELCMELNWRNYFYVLVNSEIEQWALFAFVFWKLAFKVSIRMVTILAQAENVGKLIRDLEKPAKALLVFNVALKRDRNVNWKLSDVICPENVLRLKFNIFSTFIFCRFKVK